MYNENDSNMNWYNNVHNVYWNSKHFIRCYTIKLKLNSLKIIQSLCHSYCHELSCCSSETLTVNMWEMEFIFQHRLQHSWSGSGILLKLSRPTFKTAPLKSLQKTFFKTSHLHIRFSDALLSQRGHIELSSAKKCLNKFSLVVTTHNSYMLTVVHTTS